MTIKNAELIEMWISGIPTAELLVSHPAYSQENVSAKYAVLIKKHPVGTFEPEKLELGVIVEQSVSIGIQVKVVFIDEQGAIEKHKESLIQAHKDIHKREVSKLLNGVYAANIISKTISHKELVLN
ncbi:hypothetical protein LMH73_022925 [Vibrio splendidus]|nr:hypothetical protein [Vibrio splendidus]MCC4883203.1 hypothetical protein [Vibrio splendidus]